jgi:hypothetical protein
MWSRISDLASGFSDAPIDLGSEDRLPLGYMAGHCLGRAYSSDDLLSADISADLHAMLAIYRRLINRGGTVPSDIMLEEAETQDIIEARRYTLSRRIERSPKVRKQVLSAKAPLCEGCGLDPAIDYSFSGPLERTPLDVHHIAPLASLAEGETKRYKIPSDFMILCPTCHRAIHRQDDPGDLSALKKAITFKHLREIL